MKKKTDRQNWIVITVCIAEIIISLVVLRRPLGHYTNAKNCDSVYLVSIYNYIAFVDEDFNLITPFDYRDYIRNNDCYILVNRKRDDLRSRFEDLLNIDLGKHKVPYSFIDKSGRIISRHTYNRIAASGSKGLYRVYDNGKQGLVDMKGETIIKPEFDSITNFSHGYASIKKNGMWGFINSQRLIVEPQFDSIFYDNNDIAKIEKNGKWGWAMLDTTLSIVEPNYYQIEYGKGVFKVKESKGEGYCIINSEGERLTDGEYDVINLCDGYAITMKNDLWGYFFYDTRKEITPQFSYAYKFSNDIAKVQMNGDNYQTQYTFINTKGDMIANQWFKSANSFQNGLAAVKIDEGWGYIDEYGKMIGNQWFKNAYSFQNGLAAVETDKGWGCIDEYGGSAIEPGFAESFSFNNNSVAVVKVSSTNKKHLINKKGGFVFQEGYEDIIIRNDGTFDVKNNLWGRIDSTGRSIVPLICEKQNDIFNYGDKYKVKIPEGYVLYDHKGNRIPNQDAFDEIGPYSSDGLFSIRIGDRWGFIGSNGSCIVDPQYDQVGVYSNGFAAVKKGEAWGLIDSTGEEIVAPRYERIGNVTNGFAPIKKDGLWGIVDTQDKEVIEPRYLYQIRVNDQGQFVTNIAGIDCLVDSTKRIRVMTLK